MPNTEARRSSTPTAAKEMATVTVLPGFYLQNAYILYMKTISILLPAILTTTTAMATTLPIAGAYGDREGCRQYAHRNDPAINDTDPDWIVVTPTGALGHEWGCAFQSVHGSKITAACANGGDATSQIVTVTAVENRPAGILTYTDAAGRFVLHRCE